MSVAQGLIVRSFPPIARPDARCLILGSMPGVASLNAGQYYAHPQNRFWPIMGHLLGFDVAQTPYIQRVACLQQAGVAVWDVLQSCERAGSLDADIRRETQVVNEFPAFFAAHPLITRVYFNGAHAEQVFKRWVLPVLPAAPRFRMVRLPSTSPTHASLTLEDKLAAWQQVMK